MDSNLLMRVIILVSLTDLAPGNDEIYEEKQETFMTVGNPQDGQVVLYKVGTSSERQLKVYCWRVLLKSGVNH